MDDIMLDMALNHFGFSDDQKTRIKAAIPKAQYLAALVKSHKSVINEMIDVVEMILTQVNKQEGTKI